MHLTFAGFWILQFSFIIVDEVKNIGKLTKLPNNKENKGEQNNKKVLTLILSGALLIGLLAGCTSNETTTDPNSNADDQNTASNPITVISREDGSGTRSAFEEIVGVDGACQYTNEYSSTGDVIGNVASNPSAIGYASLSAVGDNVKAVKVNGVECSEATVQDGTYEIQRPFVMVTVEGAELSEAAQAFFDFATSADASELISGAGAVPVA